MRLERRQPELMTDCEAIRRVKVFESLRFDQSNYADDSLLPFGMLGPWRVNLRSRFKTASSIVAAEVARPSMLGFELEVAGK
jgi:hypothetical protein